MNPSCLGAAPFAGWGFGAMQLPGPGVFGPPADRGQALQVLRRAVTPVSTTSTPLSSTAPTSPMSSSMTCSHPYPEELVLVSKVGAKPGESGEWLAAQRPDELRTGVEANLRSLALEQVPVVNLRRHPDGEVPLDEQVHAMVSLRDEGLIGSIGLSNVTLDEFVAARALTEIACVQNAYNVSERSRAVAVRRVPDRGRAFRALLPPRLGVPRRESRLERPCGPRGGATAECHPGPSSPGLAPDRWRPMCS